MHNSSLFANPIGLVVLLLLVIAALYAGAGVIAAFLLLILLLCASACLWSRSVLERTEVTLPEGQTACHAGETLDLRICVRSRSFFPLIWLDVVLPLGESAILVREGDDPAQRFELPMSRPIVGLRERFVWLLWQQEITCEERLCALRRGVVPVENISLQAGDGLGMAACHRWAPLTRPTRFVVYPRLMRVDIRPFLKLLSQAETGPRGQTEDITLLKSSRPYQHGDPMKRINWRYLAMTGRMEVNQYETITPGCITFFLDLFSFRQIITVTTAQNTRENRVVVRQEELETMISLIASCMQALSEQGLRFALIIPGYDRHESLLCPPGSGELALYPAMEALAAIDYHGAETQLPIDEIRRKRRKLGVFHVCAYSDAPTVTAMLGALGVSRLRAIACTRDDDAQSTGELECTLVSEMAESVAPPQPDMPQGGA